MDEYEIERQMIEMIDAEDHERILREADAVRSVDIPGHGPEACER